MKEYKMGEVEGCLQKKNTWNIYLTQRGERIYRKETIVI